MITHTLIQGTPEWQAYRAAHFNASDAPAMLGVSPYKTRDQLLREMHTGLAAEVDAYTQQLFDNGHRYESLARPLAEEIIGQDLYPVTGSEGKLSASFDGLTMDESICFEHKSLNDEIRQATCAGDLGIHLRVQMEQQIMIANAEKCLFMASTWGPDNELIDEVHHWYTPDHELREKIIQGWTQFAIDLENYQPVEVVEKPKAEPIMRLPALAVQIRGEVVVSNLPEFRAKAEVFIANIKTDLVTDQDFADAEEVVKFCEKAEKDLQAAKNSAIGQTASIDELMRTIDYIQEQLRAKRLSLDKTVKSKKEQIKADILKTGKDSFAAHLVGLNNEFSPLTLSVDQPDFAGAMKGKRTLSSLHEAVNTTLANSLIATNAEAEKLRKKLAWFKLASVDFLFLFSDLQSLIAKDESDFKAAVDLRILNHKEAEQKRKAEQARLEIQKQQAELVEKAAEQERQAAAEEAGKALLAGQVKAQTTATPATVTALSTANAPNASQIVEVVSDAFNVPFDTALAWLVSTDFSALRKAA